MAATYRGEVILLTVPDAFLRFQGWDWRFSESRRTRKYQRLFISRGNSPQRHREHEVFVGVTRGHTLRRFGRRAALRVCNTSILKQFPNAKKRGQPLQQTFFSLADLG